jgi:RNA polymerase sigma factor (sigma-70 family)
VPLGFAAAYASAHRVRIDASAPSLRAPDSAIREAAWEELIAAQTRLLLAVARSYGGGHDELMDRYAYVLEKLRESDFRRLRAYSAGRGASFSTFLTVTARRLCLDFHRSRFGRKRTDGAVNDADALRVIRRNLFESLAQEVDADSLPDSAALSADELTVREERNSRLQIALGTLQPRERLLLVLRFEDDHSASRIADMLGLPTPFHAYRAINAVLARLRVALVASGVDGVDG